MCIRDRSETMKDEEAMAKKIKYMMQAAQPQVITILKDNGKYSDIGKDTCITMMTKHYPTHTDLRQHVYTHNKVKTSNITKSNYKP